MSDSTNPHFRWHGRILKHMAQVNPALQNQHSAAEQMKQSLLAAGARDVQPEVRPSLDAAVAALAAYQEQLVKLHLLEAQAPEGHDPAQLDEERQAIYARADQQMATIKQSQAEISTMMGHSEIMQRSMVTLEGAHAQLAPQRSVTRTQGQTQTIQEKMYGHRVEHEADGTPKLSDMSIDSDSAQTMGLGVELGVEQQTEHEGAGEVGLGIEGPPR